MRSFGASSSFAGSTRPNVVRTRNVRQPHLHHRPRHPQGQAFHTTAPRSVRHKSPFRNITKAEMDRIERARMAISKKYTDQELAELKRKYTPEQYASILAAEEAVDMKDLARAKPRQDGYRPREIDSTSYARIQPTIDKRIERIRGGWDNAGDKAPRRMNKQPDAEEKMQKILETILDPSYNPHDAAAKRREQIDQAAVDGTPLPPPSATAASDEQDLILSKLMGGAEIPDDVAGKTRTVNDVDEPNALENEVNRIGRELKDTPLLKTPRRSTRKRLEDILNWRTLSAPEVAPEVPLINDPKVRWQSQAQAQIGAAAGSTNESEVEAIAQLARTIGAHPIDFLKYKTKVLVTRRVVNQTRLGKIGSMYMIAVAGDKNGMVGLGEAKSAEPEQARSGAILNAIRNMRPVLRYEGRTIYGEVRGKSGATTLTLAARPPGFGLRASGKIFEIMRAAGIYDVAARVQRGRNQMNVAKAVWQALCSQRDPDEVARARGKKLVDVRKVYYAGAQ